MPYTINAGEAGLKMTDLIKSEAIVTAAVDKMLLSTNGTKLVINIELTVNDFLKDGDTIDDGFVFKLADIKNAEKCSFKIGLLPGSSDKIASLGGFVKAVKHTSGN